MHCHNCIIDELKFEILVEDKDHPQMISYIINNLNRTNTWHCTKGKILIIKESGVRDFLDFSKDHMNQEAIYFRIDHGEWRPISEVYGILDMRWVDELIMNESVICYFQPIVNAKGEIYGYEMLSRFTREDGSLIYPNEVFTAAKKRERLYALDRLCRMTAVRYAAPLKKKAFINFIPTSIYSPEFCLKSTVQLANELGADPSQFVFEVVETEEVGDIAHLKRILAYYNKKGFKYALDDVGEGYSTIELLSELMPQYMKLDIKYVQGVVSDSGKQRIATEFLLGALQIGAVPLAEGVETREDFEWLKKCGYVLFQGYYFGKPSLIPKEERILDI
ncbi:EAL domain-containing protein [Paenibacillus frigoriresistens]|nr:EAL domain-containing protein [Paenibacillus frigoriresistens]